MLVFVFPFLLEEFAANSNRVTFRVSIMVRFNIICRQSKCHRKKIYLRAKHASITPVPWLMLNGNPHGHCDNSVGCNISSTHHKDSDSYSI